MEFETHSTHLSNTCISNHEKFEQMIIRKWLWALPRYCRWFGRHVCINGLLFLYVRISWGQIVNWLVPSQDSGRKRSSVDEKYQQPVARNPKNSLEIYAEKKLLYGKIVCGSLCCLRQAKIRREACVTYDLSSIYESTNITSVLNQWHLWH